MGCAGAYDDTAKKTSAAVAELLHTAGVSFAVLGSGESCTGDPARRAGNEALFQMLAAQAIDTLTEAKPQKIVVSCAHCFNTIAGEYPELGGHFDVVHHTQLLNRLVRDGLLTPVAPTASAASAGADSTDEAGAASADTAPSVGAPLKVTYHDACFLGRHNRIYEPPRELVGSLPNVELVEMPRNRDRAMCCGAGGAHAWFEETRGTRIADARIVEAASTGADVVATACPFCSQMLGSASGTSAGFVSSDAPTRAPRAPTPPRPRWREAPGGAGRGRHAARVRQARTVAHGRAAITHSASRRAASQAPYTTHTKGRPRRKTAGPPSSGQSVLDADDDVGGLDDGDGLGADGQAELLDGGVRDRRGDDQAGGDLDLDDAVHGALGDLNDGAGELVTCGELHDVPFHT